MNELTVVSLWRAEAADTTLKEMSRYVDRARREMPVPLLEATPLDIRAWVAAHEWQPGTKAFAIRSMRCFYSWMATAHLRDDDPTADIPLPVQVATAWRAAGDTVRKELLSGALTVRDRVMVEMLVGTGMRVAEAGSLKLGNVNVDAGTALVRKTKAQRPRTVPVMPRSMKALREYMIIRVQRDTNHDGLWITGDDDKEMALAE